MPRGNNQTTNSKNGDNVMFTGPQKNSGNNTALKVQDTVIDSQSPLRGPGQLDDLSMARSIRPPYSMPMNRGERFEAELTAVYYL